MLSFSDTISTGRRHLVTLHLPAPAGSMMYPDVGGVADLSRPGLGAGRTRLFGPAARRASSAPPLLLFSMPSAFVDADARTRMMTSVTAPRRWLPVTEVSPPRKARTARIRSLRRIRTNVYVAADKDPLLPAEQADRLSAALASAGSTTPSKPLRANTASPYPQPRLRSGIGAAALGCVARPPRFRDIRAALDL